MSIKVREWLCGPLGWTIKFLMIFGAVEHVFSGSTFLLIFGRFCIPNVRFFHDCWHRFFNAFVCAGPSKQKGGYSKIPYKTLCFSYFFELRASQFQMRATHFSIHNCKIFGRMFVIFCH